MESIQAFVIGFVIGFAAGKYRVEIVNLIKLLEK